MADYNSDRTGSNIDLTLDKVDALDAKVQPTATGVDVTGTITADGLSIGSIRGLMHIGTGDIEDDGNTIDFNGARPLSFSVSGTERARIDSSGNLLVGTTSSPTGSGQIVANNGIYLGGTGAANKLDDYEEGTWTPTYGGTVTTGTGTYDFQEGKYTKVGNLVTLSGYFLSTSHTGTGNIVIRDLPFTVENGNGNYGSLVIGESFNLAKNTDTVLSGYVIPNTDRIQLRQISTTSPASSSHVAMDGNFTLLFSITYRTV